MSNKNASSNNKPERPLNWLGRQVAKYIRENGLTVSITVPPKS